MSSQDAEPPAPVHRRVVRTVTPPYRSRPDEEMNAIGLAYLLGLLVLLVPLLPFLVIVWAISKVVDAVAGR
ncbi:MAG: hypothetical protein ABEJ70_09525 [Halobacteriaceae archaeon]